MREDIHVSWSKHETPSQLERIPAQLVLRVTGCPRASSRLCVVRSKQVQQIGLSEPGGTIRQLLLIDEKREIETGFLAEEPCVGSIAESHRR